MSDITYSVLHNAEKLTVENFDISATQLKEGNYSREECIRGNTIFGLIWNGRSNIAQFWFSKSFFYIKNQPNLSDSFFIEQYKNRRTVVRKAFIIDIF